MDIKDKALETIEGLTFDDIKMTTKTKLSKIYMFAHIAQDKCKNPQVGWVMELDETYNALKKAGIL